MNLDSQKDLLHPEDTAENKIARPNGKAGTGARAKGGEFKPDQEAAIDQNASLSKPGKQNTAQELNEKRMGRYFLLGLVVLLTIAIISIFKIFLVPIILAATFATIFHPLYRWLLKLFHNNKGISSIACCLILIGCLMLPAYIITNLVVKQSITLYQTAEPFIKGIVQDGGKSVLLERIRGLPFPRWLTFSSINWSSLLQQIAGSIAGFSTRIINKTSSGILELLFNLFVVLFTMFYFFMDGERLVRNVRQLSPLSDEYEDMIIRRFLMVSRATVLGTLVIAVTQGTLGALTLLLLGIDSWLLLGFVMIILSLIPTVGAWIVLVPSGIYQLLTGKIWQGIGIILASILVVSMIDNLMRPRLVGHNARMHDLLIFFSTIGGIAVFGLMGFIVGPVIAALYVAIIDIYSREFRTG